MLRIDVKYQKPEGYFEYGLVDHEVDAEPANPTLFIGAYCHSKSDFEWLEARVKAFLESGKEGPPMNGG